MYRQRKSIINDSGNCIVTIESHMQGTVATMYTSLPQVTTYGSAEFLRKGREPVWIKKLMISNIPTLPQVWTRKSMMNLAAGADNNPTLSLRLMHLLTH